MTPQYPKARLTHHIGRVNMKKLIKVVAFVQLQLVVPALAYDGPVQQLPPGARVDYVVTVCSDLNGVSFQNNTGRNARFEAHAFGYWTGYMRGNKWMDATGLPEKVAEPRRLPLPMSPPGSLIIMPLGIDFRNTGTATFDLFPGQQIWFDINDYPDARHDNRGCLVVLLTVL